MGVLRFPDFPRTFRKKRIQVRYDRKSWPSKWTKERGRVRLTNLSSDSNLQMQGTGQKINFNKIKENSINTKSSAAFSAESNLADAISVEPDRRWSATFSAVLAISFIDVIAFLSSRIYK